MDYIKRHGVAAGIIAAVVLLGGLFIYNNHQASETQKNNEAAKVAAEEKKADEKAATEKKTKAKAEAANKSGDYSFTTAAGDNYTYLARKAVQTYAKANSVELSKAQIIAAETKLAEKAGWVAVDVNQKVTLANADVKSAVDEVKAFNAEQKAAWAVYEAYVVL